MGRNRFSGALSLKNRLSQFLHGTYFILKWSILMAIISGVLTFYQISKNVEEEAPGFISYYARTQIKKTGLNWNILTQPSDKDVVEEKAERNMIKTTHRLHWVPLNVSVVFLVVFILLLYLAYHERDLQTLSLFKRGAICCNLKEFNNHLKKYMGKGIIKIGDVRVPFKLENLSFFLIGRPQQGKTQIILRVIDTVMQRGDRMLIWCAKREDFITTHFRETVDHVFCPGDARSIKWSIKNDIISFTDFDDIAARLVPDAADKNGPWCKGAREIVSCLMRYWWLNTDRSNSELSRIFNTDIESMYSMLAKLPDCSRVAGLLQNAKSGASYSFYITVAVYVKPFDLLAKNDGDFSIRHYLQGGRGNIYILSGGRMKKALQPVQTLFIDLFMLHHMDLQQDRNRRIWYVLDELPALNKLPRLEELLNVGPSYGASCIIGTQSFALIDSIYDETGRRAIFNACNTAAVFSIGDDKTAEELSKNLGTEEVNQAKQNYSISVTDGKDSTSSVQDDKKQELYLPDEIKGLKAMNCIVRVLGVGITETNLKLKVWPTNNPDFVADPRYSLSAYEAEHKSLLDKLPAATKNGVMSRQQNVGLNTKTINSSNHAESTGKIEVSQTNSSYVDNVDELF